MKKETTMETVSKIINTKVINMNTEMRTMKTMATIRQARGILTIVREDRLNRIKMKNFPEKKWLNGEIKWKRELIS